MKKAWFIILTLVALSSRGGDIVKMVFTVSMGNPAQQRFHVQLRCDGLKGSLQQFKMPAWTTGYYQILDFAKYVENFTVSGNGNCNTWEKKDGNTWQVNNGNCSSIVIDYDIKTGRPFVATNFIDSGHAYISPAGTFLHIAGKINNPATIIVKPFSEWEQVATGLEPVKGKKFTYTASDFDVLYDAPILTGKLESLPAFKVKGIPHYFIGYKLGDFDRVQFLSDLKKIVETASGMIGDIPYKHYTFLAIGPGNGGIEHLNSASLSFKGEQLNSREGRIRMLSFIAHEYFHHYNVKRIRPIELGPFNYDKANRTNMLWVSEGLSVYYEYMILRRAGLINDEELLDLFKGNLLAYENKPGHSFQSLTQSSYETWSDGPFGRTGDEVNKTISYYDKGPVIGLMLDFAIRHESGNKHSLDDVMRYLYYEYYKKRNRGFREDEFQNAAERMAGNALPEIFDYVTTVKAPDYPKYFGYGGLDIDTTLKAVPGAWLGVNGRFRNDTLRVSNTEWASPAWDAGIRAGDVIISIDGGKASGDALKQLSKSKKTGDAVTIVWYHNDIKKEQAITLNTKFEKPFTLNKGFSVGLSQAMIFDSWVK